MIFSESYTLSALHPPDLLFKPSCMRYKKDGTWNIVAKGDITQVAITVSFLHSVFDIICVISEMLTACEQSKMQIYYIASFRVICS